MKRAWKLSVAALRVGVSNLSVSRAEIVLNLLSVSLPLAMLPLWRRASEDAPIAGYTPGKFTAYFLLAACVQFLCAWQQGITLGNEVRSGLLGMRLMRPIHPLVQYAFLGVSSLPGRFLAFFPLCVGTWLLTGTAEYSQQLAQLLLFPLLLIGASVSSMFVSLFIGTFSLIIDSWLALAALWGIASYTCSGAVFPLSFLPEWVTAIVRWLPFKYFVSVPVETALGTISLTESLLGLLVQWSWAGAFALGALVIWSLGIDRFQAHGG